MRITTIFFSITLIFTTIIQGVYLALFLGLNLNGIELQLHVNPSMNTGITFSSTEIIRNQDLSEFSAEFSVVIISRATGTKLLARQNTEYPECLLACVYHLKCKSVNYNQNIKMCELMDTNITKNTIFTQKDWVAIGTDDSEKVSEIDLLIDSGYSVWRKHNNKKQSF